MKILLMTPLRAFVEEPPNVPDLGLGYIATSLRNRGHEVSIKDWNIDSSGRDFKGWLTANKPQVVGIKVFTKDVGAAKKTISIIKKTIPEVIVVIGGPHPSAVDGMEIMEDFTECDFAIKGEAEISFPLLLNEILGSGVDEYKGLISKERAKRIPGLVWQDKEMVHSNRISLIHDLDKIDFASWDLLDPNNYSVDMLGSEKKEGAAAPIITTRGCPGKCSYCSAYSINGRKIRSRSPENVFEEMVILYSKYKVNKFMFMDNCFTAIKKNLKALCEMIIKEKLDIEWDCNSYEALDNLTLDTLRLMYDAGCRMIHMGIESGSEKTRKVMNKFCSLKEITEKVQSIKRNGIKVGAWFMIGFPEETKKEMKNTIKYALSLNADLITFTIVFPLPGTEIYNHLKEKYRLKSIEWSNFDILNSPYPLSELPSKKLTRLLKKIRFRIYVEEKLKGATHFLGRK